MGSPLAEYVSGSPSASAPCSWSRICCPTLLVIDPGLVSVGGVFWIAVWIVHVNTRCAVRTPSLVLAVTENVPAVVGVPAILVPFPGAVDDHQTANARYLVDAGASVLIADAELDGARLAAEIDRLLAQPGGLDDMRQRLRRLAQPQATRHLAEAVGYRERRQDVSASVDRRR